MVQMQMLDMQILENIKFCTWVSGSAVIHSRCKVCSSSHVRLVTCMVFIWIIQGVNHSKCGLGSMHWTPNCWLHAGLWLWLWMWMDMDIWIFRDIYQQTNGGGGPETSVFKLSCWLGEPSFWIKTCSTSLDFFWCLKNHSCFFFSLQNYILKICLIKYGSFLSTVLNLFSFIAYLFQKCE